MKYISILVFFLYVGSGSNAQNNYALNFNGSASLDCGMSAAFNITGTGITTEAWIYPTAFGTNYWDGTIIGKDATNNTGFVLRCGATGQLSFVIAVTGSVWVEAVSANNALSLNKWQHVAGVYNGSTLKLYINGMEVQSVNETRSMIADAAYGMRIGNSPGAWAPARAFTGKIDEARVWNVARSAIEVRTNLMKHISTGTGLVASYQMSDGSGSSVTDNSGNGHTATVGSGATWVPSPIQLTGNALSFDGTDDDVLITRKSAHDITTAITLESWVYATKNTGTQNVISKSTNLVNTGYIFPRTDDGWATCVFYLHIGGAWRTLTVAYPSLNAWHHLAATYDGTMMKVYIDGTLSGTLAQSGAISSNSNDLVLGNQTGFSEYFGGKADDIRVWNVARTQAEIQASMSRELNPATATGLVAYYTFNQGITAGTNTGLNVLVDQAGTQNGVLNNFALTGASSNFVAQNSNIVILPLDNLILTARHSGKDILLSWKAGIETQVSGYQLQYSQDADHWIKLAEVNSNPQHTYQYLHASPGNGTWFYRLKVMNTDESYTYSSICRYIISGNGVSPLLYPNPASQGVVYIQLEQPGYVFLYDQSGRQLKCHYLQSGVQRFNIAGISPGVYQVLSPDAGFSGRLVIR